MGNTPLRCSTDAIRAARGILITEVEILAPRLRAELSEAFPEYQSRSRDSGRRGDAPELGLRIDRSLLAALLPRSKRTIDVSERGTGARIAAFYDRLAKVAARAGATASSCPVRGHRHRSNISISVDLNERKYVQKMKIGEVSMLSTMTKWGAACQWLNQTVHVANGLVRAITGEYYDISSIVEFLVPSARRRFG